MFVDTLESFEDPVIFRVKEKVHPLPTGSEH